MKKIITEHRAFWNSEKRRSFYVSILLLVLAVALQIGTGRYAAKSATNFVGDLILDHLPVVHLDFMIVAGAVFFVVLIGAVLALKPRYLLFGLKAMALLVITRAFFISLTHLGIYPEQITLDNADFLYSVYRIFDFQGNFFFSGHTAMPFLMALILWRERAWRLFFFAVATAFGASVLFAHIHYSIDVFAAPFIAYGVFKLTEKIFYRDYVLTQDA